MCVCTHVCVCPVSDVTWWLGIEPRVRANGD